LSEFLKLFYIRDAGNKEKKLYFFFNFLASKNNINRWIFQFHVPKDGTYISITVRLKFEGHGCLEQ
jgi:hypothetical protein